jgi:hypothetical protein
MRTKRYPLQAQSAAGYFPTILGAAGQDDTVDPTQRDSIFSIYNGSTQARFSAHVRPLLVGGGIAVLTVLFLLGQNFVDSRSAQEDAGGSVKAETIAGPEPLPATAQKVDGAPAEQKALKNFRQPVRAADPAEGHSDLLPVKQHSPQPVEKLRPAVVKDDIRSPVSKTAADRADSAKSPDNGKIKQRAEPEKKAADRRTTASPDKAGIATRPRIVKVPSP